MNDPELFMKHEESVRIGFRNIVEECFKLLDHNKKEESTVLDIGCGPGNITHDILFPLFKNPISKVVGADMSKKMVEFANATYGNRLFSFELFDVSKEVIPEKYVSYFDYVFSFWTLHFIRDQRKAFSNIYKVMKPNGQMVVYYIARSEIAEVYKKVWHKPEYATYIKDFKASRSLFQESKDQKKDLQNILEQCGFEVRSIKIKQAKQMGKSVVFKEFFASINPAYDQIPDHLKDEFMEDHLKEVRNMHGNDLNDDYYVTSNNFVVYALKK